MGNLALVERLGLTARITLQRPEKMNALDRALLEELVDVVAELDADPEVRVIVLRGQGRAFAAGADVGELADGGAIELWGSGFSEHWDRLAATKTPLVAAISGYALGGGLELALLCDVVIAGQNAIIGFPETRVGVLPGAGGTQRLVRAVGKPVAMDLLLTGRRIDAPEALRMGLVSRVVSNDDLDRVGLEVADEIAAGAPLAVAMTKQAVLQAFEMPLTAGIAYERALSALIADSDDRNEGLAALLERRRPIFQGR